MSIGTDVKAAGDVAWRNDKSAGIPASGENEPDKAEIRAFVAALGAGLDQITASLASIGEGVVAGDARIVSTKAILDGNLNFSAGTIAVVYNDGANSGYYLKIGASGTGSWSKISAMTLPAEIIDRVTALETDVAALGAMSLKDTIALTDIEQIPDQTILGRTGPGTGSGPVNAMTPTTARNLIDAPSKSDLEDVRWYSFSVGDSTSCIFIGDSLTAGLGALMNKGPIQKVSAYTNLLCHNYGRPGYVTGNLPGTIPASLLTSLRAQSEVFLMNIQTLRPTYAMVLTGANDVGTFAEREDWLRQLGETAAGQGCEVSFARSSYWIGGEQSSILYSAMAERFGGSFVDIRRAYNLFCLTGKTPGYWYGNHPGTRVNDIFAGPLTEWAQSRDVQQSIKLFRARDESAAIADLAFHPADFYARDQRWREICVGERSIAPEDSSLYDTIQDGFEISDRNSEYASLIKGNSLNMGNIALVVITMPANASNLESVQIDIGADVDACYYYNPIVSPYASAGEAVGNWAPVTLTGRTFTFNETYLSRAVWGDQIVLLLTATAGVQLSAPTVRWKGRPGKPAAKAKPSLAGGEYLAATDAGADAWVLSSGAVQRAPSDGSLPVGCTRVIALDAGESASQPIDLPAESVDARELELTVWVRRPPTVSVGIATHDTARVSVGLSSGTLVATGDVVAGLWWRECRVRLTVPPGLAAPSLVITTDRAVEVARGGVALGIVELPKRVAGLENALAEEVGARAALVDADGLGAEIVGADRIGLLALISGILSVAGLQVEADGTGALRLIGAGRRGGAAIGPGLFDVAGLSAHSYGDGIGIVGRGRRGVMLAGPDGVHVAGLRVSGETDRQEMVGAQRFGALSAGPGGASVGGLRVTPEGDGFGLVGCNRLGIVLSRKPDPAAAADPTPVFSRHLHLVEGEDLPIYPRQMLPVRRDEADVVMTLAGDPAPWADTSADRLRAGDGIGDAAVIVARPRGVPPGTVRALALPVRRAATYPAGTGPTVRVSMVGDSIVHNGGAALVKAALSGWGYQPTMIGTMLNSGADGYAGELGEGRSGWAAEDYTYSSTDRALVLPVGQEPDYLAMSLSDQRDRNVFLRDEVGTEVFARNGQVFDYAFYLSRFSISAPDVIVDDLVTNTVRNLVPDAIYDQVYDDEIIRLSQYRTGAPSAAIIRVIPGPPRTAVRDQVWQDKYIPAIRAVQQAIADLGDSRTVLVAGWAHATAEAGYLLTGATDAVTGIQTATISDDIHPYGAPRAQLWRAVAMAAACAADGIF